MSIIGRACGFFGAVLPDPYFSSVKLLLHGDGSNGGTTFTDSSSIGKTPTVNASFQTLSAKAKFGPTSMGSSTTGDGLTYTNADADLLPGSGDFTIEFWMNYASSSGTSGNICSNGSGTNFIISAAGGGISGTDHKLNVYTSGITLVSTTSVDDGTWKFIAISRVGTTLNLYVNGTREDSQTNSVNLSSGQLKIGNGYHTIPTGSYIDDFRFTKGVGRYTGTTCAVPTAAFPNF